MSLSTTNRGQYMWAESCLSAWDDRDTYIQCQQQTHTHTKTHSPSFPLHVFRSSRQVNNACSTGSSALLLAKQLVEGGTANCVMALGFEKMERGSLMAKVYNRAHFHYTVTRFRFN